MSDCINEQTTLEEKRRNLLLLFLLNIQSCKLIISLKSTKNHILLFVAIALLQQLREEPQSESLSVLRSIEWAEIKTIER